MSVQVDLDTTLNTLAFQPIFSKLYEKRLQAITKSVATPRGNFRRLFVQRQQKRRVTAAALNRNIPDRLQIVIENTALRFLGVHGAQPKRGSELGAFDVNEPDAQMRSCTERKTTSAQLPKPQLVHWLR